MAVAGLRGTGDWGTDERPKDFRNNILFVNPNGDSPIFALTGRVGKKTVTDPEYHWWAEPQNIVRLQVVGNYVAGDTLITVDSVDPGASTLTTVYGVASHLKAGDHLWVEPAADAAAFTQEVLEVVSVLSDTQFIVSRGAQGTTPAAISNDQYLLLVGSAYGEGTAAPQARSRNPVKYYNYVQTFKDSYELTGTADATEARTGDPWSNDKKRKTFDHSRAIELSMMLSRKSETTDSNGKPKRTMSGLREQVGNVTVFGSAVNVGSFTDAIAPCFKFSTGQSDSTRVVFMGNGARIEMSKVIQNATGVAIDVAPPFEMWGMKFQRWITPLGELAVKTHPLMSQHTLLNKAAFVLDFSALKYVTMKGRDTKYKDDVQNKDEDLRRGFIQTDCSLMLDAGGITCAYLGNISAT